MYRKRRGSMLIEVLAGLMILMIASSMIMTSTIAVNRSKIKRDKEEELSRVAYCIMNEIKYNYSYEEINQEMLIHNGGVIDSNIMEFEYTDDILSKLTITNLFQIEEGEGIKIEKVREVKENKIIEMKISIKFKIGSSEFSVERTFNKSWWMYDEKI